MNIGLKKLHLKRFRLSVGAISKHTPLYSDKCGEAFLENVCQKKLPKFNLSFFSNYRRKDKILRMLLQVVQGSPPQIHAADIWALPVRGGGGLNPCPDGLGHFFREEFAKIKSYFFFYKKKLLFFTKKSYFFYKKKVTFFTKKSYIFYKKKVTFFYKKKLLFFTKKSYFFHKKK